MNLFAIDISKQRVVERTVEPASSQIFVEYLTSRVDTVTQDTRITVDKDAVLFYVMVIASGNNVRKHVTIELAGEGSNARLHGIVLGSGANKLHLTSVTLHSAPHTKARIEVNGVLRDKSELDYDGLIKIVPHAQITDSYLASHTLLLSDACRANAIPSLEIEAHEVKCSHEATIAPIDEEQLFYMASRGIRGEVARTLITKGFLLPPIEELPASHVRTMLIQALTQAVEFP